MKIRQSGFTVVELLVVFAVLGVSLGVGALYLKPAAAPLATSAALVEGYTRQARMRAMATTSAYRIRPVSAAVIAAESAGSCMDEIWAASSIPDLALEEQVELTDTDWTVCFSGRGVSSNNVVITLSHPDFGTKQVEVLLGGTTRIIDG